MTQLFHDGHLRIKPTIADIALHELPSGKLLDGEYLTIDLGCYLVHGGKGAPTDRFEEVVLRAPAPGSFLSTPRGVRKIGLGGPRSGGYHRTFK